MKAIAALLVVGAILPASAFVDIGSEYFLKIKADIRCKGRPVVARVEVLEEDLNEYTHDKLASIEASHVEVLLSESDPTLVGLEDDLEVFLRVHYDCGCGPVYDSITSPEPKQHMYRYAAEKDPWHLNIELSDCDAQREQ
uniref:DUF2155 domain-containing protein n=1 Tax=Panagrellus redivivus TaxID=6233 RepID=A0A7E4W525_PANRE